MACRLAAEVTTVSTATNFFIGQSSGASGFANGGIDEVAIYSAALSADQVRDHYDLGIEMLHFRSPYPPLIAQ